MCSLTLPSFVLQEQRRHAATRLLQQRLPVLLVRKRALAQVRQRAAAWLPWLARLHNTLAANAVVAARQPQPATPERPVTPPSGQAVAAGAPTTAAAEPAAEVLSPEQLGLQALQHCSRAAQLGLRAGPGGWHELVSAAQCLWNSSRLLLDELPQLCQPVPKITWERAMVQMTVHLPTAAAGKVSGIVTVVQGCHAVVSETVLAVHSTGSSWSQWPHGAVPTGRSTQVSCQGRSWRQGRQGSSSCGYGDCHQEHVATSRSYAKCCQGPQVWFTGANILSCIHASADEPGLLAICSLDCQIACRSVLTATTLQVSRRGNPFHGGGPEGWCTDALLRTAWPWQTARTHSLMHHQRHSSYPGQRQGHSTFTC